MVSGDEMAVAAMGREILEGREHGGGDGLRRLQPEAGEAEILAGIGACGFETDGVPRHAFSLGDGGEISASGLSHPVARRSSWWAMPPEKINRGAQFCR